MKYYTFPFCRETFVVREATCVWTLGFRDEQVVCFYESSLHCYTKVCWLDESSVLTKGRDFTVLYPMLSAWQSFTLLSVKSESSLGVVFATL